tara:strand:- start:997 stop:1224 length:228 start_codon:yes stop_codon:yes gene_type:complete
MYVYAFMHKRNQMMTPDTVWQQIRIEELAQALSISRMAVYKWRNSDHGIPDRRLLAVEQATGIDRSDLRPDLFKR